MPSAVCRPGSLGWTISWAAGFPTQHGLTGGTRAAADVSYLADTIVLFRYYEFRGRMRRAISMPKKRASAHEHTIRDLVIDAQGLHIGPALEQFERRAVGHAGVHGRPRRPRRAIDKSTIVRR